jgi:hypothetical protein
MRTMPLDSPRMVYHALNYARRGISVFPVYEPVMGACSCGDADCANIGKHPRNAHGVSEATTDRKRIRQWWKQWPDANIGVATIGLIVIDVDPRHGGNESFAEMEARFGPLPATWRALTGGGGEHLFFRRNGTYCTNKQGLRPGVDIKTDGGYVIASPSLHKSGKRYTWK